MADMFGAGYGARPKTHQELMAGMKAVHSDLAFTVACGAAAYDALLAEASKLGVADPGRKAALGYCAVAVSPWSRRAGADFSAVVVFHVTNPNPVVPGTPCNIKGRVLAIHGSADPVTPKPMMDAFEEELTAASVNWQVVMFGGAVHSFCDPTVNDGPTRYDEKLCRKSYRLMRDFFDETLSTVTSRLTRFTYPTHTNCASVRDRKLGVGRIDQHREFDLRRGDGADVDAAGGQRLEGLGRDAGVAAHADADHRHLRHVAASRRDGRSRSFALDLPSTSTER